VLKRTFDVNGTYRLTDDQNGDEGDSPEGSPTCSDPGGCGVDAGTCSSSEGGLSPLLDGRSDTRGLSPDVDPHHPGLRSALDTGDFTPRGCMKILPRRWRAGIGPLKNRWWSMICCSASGAVSSSHFRTGQPDVGRIADADEAETRCFLERRSGPTDQTSPGERRGMIDAVGTHGLVDPRWCRRRRPRAKPKLAVRSRSNSRERAARASVAVRCSDVLPSSVSAMRRAAGGA